MRTVGWSTRWGIVAVAMLGAVWWAWGADGPQKGRYAQQAKEDRARATNLRNSFEELAASCSRYGGFMKDDLVLAKPAWEKAAALLEKAAEAFDRDDENEGWRLRKEHDQQERAIEVWRQRLWEWRRRQAESAPEEKWFRDESRWLAAGARPELMEWVRARRALSQAWGALAEATTPGADEEMIRQLKEKAFAAEGESEIARLRFDWARGREQIWSDKKVSSEQLTRKLEALRAAQEERIRLRRADIERDRQMREVERRIAAAEKEFREAFEAAREARNKAEAGKK